MYADEQVNHAIVATAGRLSDESQRILTPARLHAMKHLNAALGELINAAEAALPPA
jgi:hypothetical protein